MSNLVDLWSETQASLIGDDAQPALTLKNTSTGAGLQVDSAVITSGATIAVITGSPAIRSNITEAIPATFSKTVIGSPSVGLIRFAVSGASVPIIELGSNAFVSAVSIIFAAGANWAGMGGIRVKLSDGTTYGWIPIIPPGQFTAAAI